MLRTILILLLLPLTLFAQVTPNDGSALNYRIIGFSFPAKEQAAGYEVEIAQGSCTTDAAFKKNITITATSDKNRVVAEVPAFGREYTWRTVYLDKKSKKTMGGLHHFSTLMSPDVNPDSVRLRMLLANPKYDSDYVFVDGNAVLYDMKGQPVWFFPKRPGLSPEAIHLRDTKLTPFGTITSIINERAYEFNYNGDVIWKAPGDDKVIKDNTSSENAYHHELTRLSNGHYMVMGFEADWWQLPAPVDTATVMSLGDKLKRGPGNTEFQKMFFGTVVEYDAQGKTVWKWSGGDYFKTSDLATRMTQNGLFNLNDTHANAFYFDEKTKTLLISFRDINRVIKVAYPSGKVEEVYGKLYSAANSKDKHLINGMFCGQHSCRLSAGGELYLFNNNICNRRSAPTILVLKAPQSGNDTMTKVWEYECPMDDQTAPSPVLFGFGGNVIELPDSTLFICMGGTYGKLLIVNRDKQVLWSAQPEKWDVLTAKWSKQGAVLENRTSEGNYRSSILTRDELEHLVWGEPLGK